MFASFTNYKGCTDMSMRICAFAVGAAALLGVQAVQAQPVEWLPAGTSDAVVQSEWQYRDLRADSRCGRAARGDRRRGAGPQ